MAGEIVEASAEGLRDREEREKRLEEGRVHVLPLPVFAATMRREPEYEKNGHAGALLMRTPELRVVLEVIAAGTELPEHSILGPATICVLEGELELRTADGAVAIGEREAVVLPPAERRSIRALQDSSFLLVIAPE